MASNSLETGRSTWASVHQSYITVLFLINIHLFCKKSGKTEVWWWPIEFCYIELGYFPLNRNGYVIWHFALYLRTYFPFVMKADLHWLPSFKASIFFPIFVKEFSQNVIGKLSLCLNMIHRRCIKKNNWWVEMSIAKWLSVVDFKLLALNTVGSNTTSDFGFLHVRCSCGLPPAKKKLPYDRWTVSVQLETQHDNMFGR